MNVCGLQIVTSWYMIFIIIGIKRRSHCSTLSYFRFARNVMTPVVPRQLGIYFCIIIIIDDAFWPFWQYYLSINQIYQRPNGQIPVKSVNICGYQMICPNVIVIFKTFLNLKCILCCSEKKHLVFCSAKKMIILWGVSSMQLLGGNSKILGY